MPLIATYQNRDLYAQAHSIWMINRPTLAISCSDNGAGVSG